MPRVIINTDTANEIDDQYAVAWALLSQDRLKLEGVTAAPYSFTHHRAGLEAVVAALQSDTDTGDYDKKFIGHSPVGPAASGRRTHRYRYRIRDLGCGRSSLLRRNPTRV